MVYESLHQHDKSANPAETVRKNRLTGAMELFFPTVVGLGMVGQRVD
jgi:hypothetical protein